MKKIVLFFVVLLVMVVGVVAGLQEINFTIIYPENMHYVLKDHRVINKPENISYYTREPDSVLLQLKNYQYSDYSSLLTSMYPGPSEPAYIYDYSTNTFKKLTSNFPYSEKYYIRGITWPVVDNKTLLTLDFNMGYMGIGGIGSCKSNKTRDNYSICPIGSLIDYPDFQNISVFSLAIPTMDSINITFTVTDDTTMLVFVNGTEKYYYEINLTNKKFSNLSKDVEVMPTKQLPQDVPLGFGPLIKLTKDILAQARYTIDDMGYITMDNPDFVFYNLKDNSWEVFPSELEDFMVLPWDVVREKDDYFYFMAVKWVYTDGNFTDTYAVNRVNISKLQNLSQLVESPIEQVWNTSILHQPDAFPCLMDLDLDKFILVGGNNAIGPDSQPTIKWIRIFDTLTGELLFNRTFDLGPFYNSSYYLKELQYPWLEGEAYRLAGFILDFSRNMIYAFNLSEMVDYIIQEVGVDLKQYTPPYAGLFVTHYDPTKINILSIHNDSNNIYLDSLDVEFENVSTCYNGVKDWDEADIDCGGSCSPCINGKKCLYNADCVSNYCNPNKICSIPSCYDGWKNGDETGIDCGGSCSACPPPPPSCSDGVKNGLEEDVDCGGICPNECEYELTVLFIPVNWQGSYNYFKGTALAVSKYFLNRIPLKDCPNKYKLLISDEIDYDKERVLWDEWKCNIPKYLSGCFVDEDSVLRIIEGCAKRYGNTTGKKYEYVVGITDKDMCGTASGWSDGQGGLPSVIAESTVFGVVTHELGHEFGLADQYCDCSGTPYANYCGPTAPNNPLRKDLGCEAGSGKGCCDKYGDGPYDDRCGWCYGNYDRMWLQGMGNQRSTMSNRILPYNPDCGTGPGCGMGETGDYDINGYSHLETQLKCNTSNFSAYKLATLSTTSNSNTTSIDIGSILTVSLTVFNNDTVIFNGIDVSFGYTSMVYPNTGTYSLKVLDIDNNTIYSRNISLNFILFSDPPKLINYSHIYDKILFDNSMNKIRLYHNNSLIFQQEINFCNFDDRCESPENHFSCPNDCESWFNDGICNDEYDGVCDSDCLPQYDLDCKETINISLNKGWNLISIPLELINISINYTFNNTNPIIFGYKNNSWFIPDYIDNKFGYWVKSNASYNLTLIGNLPKEGMTELGDGWNLLGYPYLEEKNISELFDNVTIYMYNNSKWYSYGSKKFLNTLGKLKPGYGYWVKKI